MFTEATKRASANADRPLKILGFAEMVGVFSGAQHELCKSIIGYLVGNPNQREITVVGLRAALGLPDEMTEELIGCAFLLSRKDIGVLAVSFYLFDSAGENVIQIFSVDQYLDAIQTDRFIDVNGDEIGAVELTRRCFPRFTNMIND